MAYKVRDFTGEIMQGLSGIGQIGGALADRKKLAMMEKEGAARIKESEQQQKLNQQKIDAGKTAANQDAQARQISSETEARGMMTPAALEGTKTATGNAVDFQAVKTAKQADSDAKLYNMLNQGKEGFLPLNGRALAKMKEDKALAGNQADQEAIRTEERATETHVSKMANDKAAREAGRYTPVVLDGNGLGAMNTRTGTVKSTGEKVPTKPAGKAPSPEDGLPLDVKKQIEVLSTKSAGKVAIANQLESDLVQLRDAMGLDAEGNPVPGKTPNEDLAYSYAQNMLKTMNSKEGADAVGIDEAKRAAGLLEYNVADVKAGLGMKPGKFHGRDMLGFLKQVSSNVDGIKGSVEFNKKEIDRLYGRQPGATPGGSKFKILSVED